MTQDISLLTHRIKATYKDALLRWISYLPTLVVFSILGFYVLSVSKFFFSLWAVALKSPFVYPCIFFLCFNKDQGCGALPYSYKL